MKIKKSLFLILFSLLCLPFIYAVDCTEVNTLTSTDITVLNATSQSIIFGNDEQLNTFYNITPTASFNFTNTCENFTITNNATTTTLYWDNITSNSVYVTNTTNKSIILLRALGSNYSINYVVGTIFWNFSDATTLSLWNNTLVDVCYNKTFTRLVTKLDRGFTGTGSYDWGASYTLTGTRSEIYNKNWRAYYSYDTRTCSARDSCLATKVTIFAGFGLLAVIMIVISAFALIKLTQGDMTTTILGTVAIGIIALAIVIMLGYYITSTVGASVCSAAIG
jgi:hypothetical protein